MGIAFDEPKRLHIIWKNLENLPVFVIGKFLFQLSDEPVDGIDLPLIVLAVVISTSERHFQVTFLLEEVFNLRDDTFLQVLVFVVEVKDALIIQCLFQFLDAMFLFLVADHQVMKQFIESSNLA